MRACCSYQVLGQKFGCGIETDNKQLVQSPDGDWTELNFAEALLLAALADSDRCIRSGRQYLNTYTTRHGVDDVLVVLSKGEYGDELFGTG
jgi:hypothetical protein